MKRPTALILAFLLLVCLRIGAQPPAGGSDGEASYRTGIKLLQDGNAAEALPHLQAAVKANGESYLYRLNAGRAAQFSGNFQSCVANLTEALRLRPSGQTAQSFHLWRAECYAELGNRTAAASDFAKAVELQPGLKMAYGTRIFHDTGNVCRGSADGKYREAEAFHNANKIYEAYRDLYVALKCDPKHLPSLRLRLKIEAADNNLAAHAKVHRVQLAKLESAAAAANKPTPTAEDQDDDPNSDEFLDKVFDVKKTPAAAREGKPGSTPLLNKYFAQIDAMFAGRPVFTQVQPKAQRGPKPEVNIYGAVFAGDTALALELIRRGEDVNYQFVTPFGFKKSSLVEAIEKKNLTVAKALLEAGANPNCDLQLKEMCPMAPAISQNNPLAVALLIRYKVDVNGLYNSDPTTYLIAAAVHEYDEILNLLMEAGADRSARNKKGETAEQILERKKRETAAKVPPTAAELRIGDLRVLMLRRRGISAIIARFNAHMEFYKKVNGGILTSDKIRNLRQGIDYLDEIIASATEMERSAARQLKHTGYDADQRATLRTVAAEAVKAREDAENLKGPLVERISGLEKGFH